MFLSNFRHDLQKADINSTQDVSGSDAAPPATTDPLSGILGGLTGGLGGVTAPVNGILGGLEGTAGGLLGGLTGGKGLGGLGL